MKLSIDADVIKGFLDPEEGKALHDKCVQTADLGPCLEVGKCRPLIVHPGESTTQILAPLMELNVALLVWLLPSRGSRVEMFSASMVQPNKEQSSLSITM